MYIVSSPELSVAVQRNTKTLSFLAYGLKFAGAVCELSPRAEEILTTNIRRTEGPPGLGHVFTNTVHASLALGPSLDQLARAVTRNVAASVDKLDGTTTRRIQLAEWLRRELTMAAMDAVYGAAANPLKDEATDRAYCDFEVGLTSLLLTPLPHLLARKAAAGRRATIRALTNYLCNDSHKAGSEYIQARYGTCEKFGMPREDIAKMDLGGLTSLNSNASPATFWLTIAIFSRPALLASIRDEVTTVISTRHSEAATPTHTLDVTKLKEKCPLLVSTLQEVLRQRSLGATVRIVLQDTLLLDRYMLKKDGVVMIPAAALHSDPAIYGATAEEFDPYRFTRPPNNNNNEAGPGQAKTKKIPHGAFRVFGGGTSLCPGRHLAATEILTFVALLVMRFDLLPVEPVSSTGGGGSGRSSTREGQGKGRPWTVPEPNASNMATAIPAPATDVVVDVIPRKGWEQARWKVTMSALEGKFDIAAAAG